MARPPATFTRLSVKDPEVQRVISDIYDKLAAASIQSPVPVTPVVPTPTKPVAVITSIQGATGQAADPQQLFIPKVATLPAAKEGAVVEYAPIPGSTGVLLRWSTATSWEYLAGQLSVTQAQLTLLEASPFNSLIGLLVDVTDFAHLLVRVPGGWAYADPSDPAGKVEMFLVDPPAIGWALLDGSTVTYLKSDGTTGTITLEDRVSAPANAAYPKLGSPVTGAAVAAVAPTLVMDPYTPSGTLSGIPTATTSVSGGTVNPHAGAVFNATAGAVPIEVFSGAGDLVHSILLGHAHSVTPAGTLTGTPATLTGTISATGEPKSLVLRPFMRL